MERFKLMRLQPIWGNRCNSELKWLFLPLNQGAVGSTPTRPTKFLNDFRILPLDYVNLVPTFGASFFNLRVEHVHKSLLVTHRVGRDLERFKSYIESRGRETGGWRRSFRRTVSHR